MTHRPEQSSAGNKIRDLLASANGVEHFQKLQSLLLDLGRLFVSALRI